MSKRSLDGVLLLDKPVGFTSNAVLQRLKRFYKAVKAGHAGSLDPLASGLLPLCFGQATKFCQYLLGADKTYEVEMFLGKTTVTGDAEGEVLSERDASQISLTAVEDAVLKFIGDIEQVPPMYSALKHQGQPLYKLAREGKTVEREARPVHIYSLAVLSMENVRVRLRVRCSKGTYVRTLIEDIGEVLGCGAYVTKLRRTEVGPYSLKDSCTFERLKDLHTEVCESGDFSDLDACLLSLDTCVADWPQVCLNNTVSYYLLQGQAVRVNINGAVASGEYVSLYGDGNKFLGIGEILADGRVAPKRLVA